MLVCGGAMIKVERLTRYYGQVPAVVDVSFTIKSGEIVGLLGHNGAGKTTIMKMLTGYLQPSSGKIYLNDLDVVSSRQQIQQQIGYLPENNPAYPDLTVISYLEYAAKLKQIPNAKIASCINEAIDLTDLRAKAFAKIATLSRGYQQRVGVAQAILARPKILILDEPTNGLDPTQIDQMRKLITDIAKTSTVIISTHILQEVQAICDRALIIKSGSLVLDATLAEVQASQSIVVKTNCPLVKFTKMLSKIKGIKAPQVTILNCDETCGKYTYVVAVEALEAANSASNNNNNDNDTGNNTTSSSNRNNFNNLTIKDSSELDEVCAGIVTAIYATKYKLSTIYVEKRDLETIFMQLNRASQVGHNQFEQTILTKPGQANEVNNDAA